MTFFALLTKEMRLSLRRERTIWLLVTYVVLMGLLGLINLTSLSASNSPTIWSSSGTTLFILLSNMQLFLICFIAPAFTATAINGEKERQTFDMLLCSHLSALDLVGGKLLAGLSNALLLIAASIPLFSLVFFFGGISLQEALLSLIVFVMSAITTATFGLLCSTIFRRPSLSAAVAYMGILIWLFLPIVLSLMQPSQSYGVMSIAPSSAFRPTQYGSFSNGPGIQQALTPPLVLVGNPINALNSIRHNNGFSIYGFNSTPYTLGKLALAPWLAYTLVEGIAIVLFFLLSLWFIKPNARNRLRILRRRASPAVQEKEKTLADSLT